MLKEFRPTILFLVKFGVIFVLGSFFYASYVSGFQQEENPKPDPFTDWVAHQTNSILQVFGQDSHLWYPETEPIVVIYITGYEEDNVSFYEGCNGLNIMILFVAFVVAFGNRYRRAIRFIPAGILAIHVFNLFRLSMLALLATWSSGLFHFVHKFAFTGVIYAFVLFLWYLCV